jgi:predicted DCC family thiol-disulfide oxidoreductase YuxK
MAGPDHHEGLVSSGALAPPVLVFDGDCGFCTTSAAVVRRVGDRRHRFAIAPWQRLDLGLLGLTSAECQEAVQFVDAAGSVYAGHLAIAAALRHGAPGWRPAGALLEAPGISRLAARTYSWVSRHRHQLPGGTPACSLPPPRQAPQ